MSYKQIIDAVVIETPKGRVQKLAYWRIVGGLQQIFAKDAVQIDRAARAAFNATNKLETAISQVQVETTKFLEADPKIEELLIMQTEKGGCAGCNKELQTAILEAEQTDAAQAATGEKRKYTKKAKNEDSQE